MPIFTKSAPQLGQEAEALGVHDVAGTDLHGVAVVLADPADGAALPLGVALGRVDAEHVHTGLDQCGHALGVVAGVDAGADHVALVGIQQLVGVLLVEIVVLAEHHIRQVALGVHERQGVDLVVPDDVVGSPAGRCRPGAVTSFSRGVMNWRPWSSGVWLTR